MMKRRAFKSLEQLKQAPEHKEFLGDEFPHRRSIPEIDRRDALKLLGGGLALAGFASGCRFLPKQKLVPFVQSPENHLPGVSEYYATSHVVSGLAMGMLARSYEGRPIKLEGNPEHPASLGALDARMQAELLQLYDPDRIQQPKKDGVFATWESFYSELRDWLSKGERLIILTETLASPSLTWAILRLQERFPGVEWRQWEPVNRDNAYQGAAMAFGEPVEVIYDFTKAKTVVSLDADLYGWSNNPLAYARQIAERRNPDLGEDMIRLYAAECTPTTFGATADHRIPVKASQIGRLAQAILSRVGGGGSAGAVEGVDEAWLEAVADDLQNREGVVVCGEHQSAEVHAICHAINQQIGAMGEIAAAGPALPTHPRSHTDELRAVADAMTASRPAALLVVGGNPAYNAPADIDMEAAIDAAPWSAHLTLHDDETAALCGWQMPLSHFLESWGDGRAVDGAFSLQQPLIEPIYDSRSPLQVIDALAGVERDGEDIVREHWTPVFEGKAMPGPGRVKAMVEPDYPAEGDPAEVAPPAEGADAPEGEALPEGISEALEPVPAPRPQPQEASNGAQGSVMLPGIEKQWREALAMGIFRPELPAAPSVPSSVTQTSFTLPEVGGGDEVVFLPDPMIYDGRYANLGWLQEAPRPLTNMVYDNALYVGRSFAEQKDLVKTDDPRFLYVGDWPMATVSIGGANVNMAAWVSLGTAAGTAVVHLGYGRRRGGAVAAPEDKSKGGGGFDVYPLRRSDASWIARADSISKTSGGYKLVNTQFHNTLEATEVDTSRHIVQEASLHEYETEDHLGYHFHGYHPEEKKKGEGEEDHGGDSHEGEGDHGEKKDIYDRSASMYAPTQWTEENDGDENYQWAMTIDLNKCIGCGACSVACQAENNIPTVGKYQVSKGREMHWIRIDRYYMGDGDDLDMENPPIRFQPLACVQCENAPCEPVCPVAATVHSKEGINQMVYNRCVGTRYCSNNCPYKVRRFNYLHYTKPVYDIPVLELLQNPDVTVRTRGVMEKCTYCVQRINHARITAKKESRDIQDGEVVTACEQACPANAIIFGNKNDHDSRVAKSRKDKRVYKLLEEINTFPRTVYAMRVNNPHPSLKGEEVSHG